MAAVTPEIQALWSDYCANRKVEQRDQLIVSYAPIVKFVAGRVASGLPQTVEQADLVSYGMFGLIDAVERFDPGRGFKFETFAIPRIKGAMLDELRAADWVPRSIRAKAKAVQRALGKLENELGRSPSDQELAEELEYSVDELHSLLRSVSLGGIAALDETISGERGDSVTLGNSVPTDDLGPWGHLEIDEMRKFLAGSINGMPDREKTVLTLYYYESLTLADIGKVLGVTESRVSQIHTKAVLHLRSRLASAHRVN